MGYTIFTPEEIDGLLERLNQTEQRVRELEAEIIKQKDVSNALGDALAVLPTTPKQMMERVRVLEAALRSVDEAADFAYGALRDAVSDILDKPAGYAVIRMIQDARSKARAALTGTEGK